MHGQSIQHLVYRHLFPCPKSTDPPCFSAYLKNNLVAEIRTETSTFYGNFESLEAKYPGLDYTHPPHRMRLGRFPHHRRLFRAFDELGLTKSEILSLCRWEGTRWARESYERQEGIKIKDTTGQEILPFDPVLSRRHQAIRTNQLGATCQASLGVAESSTTQVVSEDVELEEADDDDDEGEELEEEEEEGDEVVGDEEDEEGAEEGAEEEDSEEELESVGIELNQRLSAGQVDEAWAEWFKEATERGVLPDPASILRAGHTFPPMSLVPGSSTVRASSSAITPPAPPTGTAM